MFYSPNCISCSSFGISLYGEELILFSHRLEPLSRVMCPPGDIHSPCFPGDHWNMDELWFPLNMSLTQNCLRFADVRDVPQETPVGTSSMEEHSYKILFEGSFMGHHYERNRGTDRSEPYCSSFNLLTRQSQNLTNLFKPTDPRQSCIGVVIRILFAPSSWILSLWTPRSKTASNLTISHLSHNLLLWCKLASIYLCEYPVLGVITE